ARISFQPRLRCDVRTECESSRLRTRKKRHSPDRRCYPVRSRGALRCGSPRVFQLLKHRQLYKLSTVFISPSSHAAMSAPDPGPVTVSHIAGGPASSLIQRAHRKVSAMLVATHQPLVKNPGLDVS